MACELLSRCADSGAETWEHWIYFDRRDFNERKRMSVGCASVIDGNMEQMVVTQ
jgi:hypothetical protein